MCFFRIWIGLILIRLGQMAAPCGHSHKISVSIEVGKYLDNPSVLSASKEGLPSMKLVVLLQYYSLWGRRHYGKHRLRLNLILFFVPGPQVAPSAREPDLF